MKKISDFVVISDVDGTLLDGEGVPERNAEAIRRFIRAGGRFAIATGRSRTLMRRAAEAIPINAPCVILNGGALYDYVEDRVLWEIHLPEVAREVVGDMMEAAPYAGVMVTADDRYYRVREIPGFQGYFEANNERSFLGAGLDEIPWPWSKGLFQFQEGDYDRFMKLVEQKGYPGVRFVGVFPTVVEMLPENVNKGGALKQLVELGYVRRENLVAVGDFYNDLEMIEYAGIGVTLSTSPDDIKAAADIVVGDCRGGAVADTIEYIERLCVE